MYFLDRTIYIPIGYDSIMTSYNENLGNFVKFEGDKAYYSGGDFCGDPINKNRETTVELVPVTSGNPIGTATMTEDPACVYHVTIYG